MATKKVGMLAVPNKPTEEIVELGDTPEITPVEVDHGEVASIYRVVATDGTAFLNVVFADGAVEQYPCDDAKWEAFQADESDWAVKAKKFYGAL